ITRAPEATRLAYLCRITVRSLHVLDAGLFLAVGSRIPLRGLASPSASALDYPDGFACPETSTALHRHNHPPTDCSLLRPPSPSNGREVVRDCSPVSHRLRLSASP